MGEGAPKPEQGSYEAFESGSFEDELSSARVKIEGVENAMTGIGEAARIARDVQGLGKVAKEFPEFKHWAKRRLNEIAAIGEKTKKGENFDSEIKEWHLDVGEAVMMWGNHPREAYLSDDPAEVVGNLLKMISSLDKLREEIDSKERSSARGVETEVQADRQDIEFIEDVQIPCFLMDGKRKDQAKQKMENLFKKYKIELPEQLNP